MFQTEGRETILRRVANRGPRNSEPLSCWRIFNVCSYCTSLFAGVGAGVGDKIQEVFNKIHSPWNDPGDSLAPVLKSLGPKQHGPSLEVIWMLAHAWCVICHTYMQVKTEQPTMDPYTQSSSNSLNE